MNLRLYDDAGAPVHVCGYASVFDRLYGIGGGVMERVQAGAFDLSRPTFAAVGHWQGRRYAGTGDGSLSLWQDGHGLAFRFRLESTWGGLSLARGVRNGTLRGVSVNFVHREVERRREGAVPVDLVTAARIDELSLCSAPACPGAVAWLDVEDDLPPDAAQARAVWSVGRQGHRLAAGRAKARARGRPRAAILNELDRVLARHRPDLLRVVRP